ncbi:MAG: fructose-6-phosphate aldolase [Candidatus Thermoplasmatota archaeon]|nr:fructose-6-phosphate aldolase [Candidatus Thermoplasmatota archaeon]
MQLFIDTAEFSEIKRYAHIIDGVTTNPTLLSKLGNNISTEEVIRQISEIITGPISVEVISEDCNGMVAEAEQLATLSSNVVIKIPMTEEGLKATTILKEMGIQTNVTLVFSANQALLAAKAGATYISIFIGRLDDLATDGMQVVRDTLIILDTYLMETEVIAASIRSPMHVLEAAKVGCHVATVPPNTIGLMMKHPLTDAGLEIFLRDAQKIGKN